MLNTCDESNKTSQHKNPAKQKTLLSESLSNISPAIGSFENPSKEPNSNQQYQPNRTT